MVYEFEAIGTKWYIRTARNTPVNVLRLKAAISERIETFDHHYSRFIGDSLVSTISQKPATYKMPADFAKMFDLYEQLYGLTDGAMTPLIGSALVDAGYNAHYSLKSQPISDVPALDQAVEFNDPYLTTKEIVLLDFGAAGKGYLVDIASEVLESAGVKSYIVDAGGDMRCRGPKRYQIGLENPDDTTEAIGIVELKNLSLCGSADNRRAWNGFTHIIDPRNKRSPRIYKAIWVMAESTLLADALTTALQFTSCEHLKEHFTFEAMLLRADGSCETTEGWKSVIFV